MRTGDRRKADLLSARAVAEFPSAPDLRFLRGRLLVEDGRNAAAVAEFEACLGTAARSFFSRQGPGGTPYAAETQLGVCPLRLGAPSGAAAGVEWGAVGAPASLPAPAAA